VQTGNIIAKAPVIEWCCLLLLPSDSGPTFALLPEGLLLFHQQFCVSTLGNLEIIDLSVITSIHRIDKRTKTGDNLEDA
jgi:hypothetical protein